MHISAVTPSTLTRLRGEEAGRKLAASMQAVAVELDLGETSPSLSFLDGLILTLRAAQVLHFVTFVTTDPRVHERLARIARERNVAVHAHPGVEPVQRRGSWNQSLELDEDIEQAREQSKFAHI